MIDKIFTFVTSNAIGLANKNITKFFETNRNKLFMWSIILFASYAAISTYVLGECVNCNETTNDEITYICIFYYHYLSLSLLPIDSLKALFGIYPHSTAAKPHVIINKLKLNLA